MASSVLNAGQQVGGSIGLAVLGTVAWTVVANSIRTQAAHAAAAARAGRAAQPSHTALTAAYHHALASGFSRAFLVGAAIMLFALAVTAAAIRIRRCDLAGAAGQGAALPDPVPAARQRPDTTPAPSTNRRQEATTMTVVRTRHYCLNPADLDELLAQRAALITKVRAAYPGLAEARLIRLEDGSYRDAWHWDTAAQMQAALPATALAEARDALGLARDYSADYGEVIDER